MRVFYEGSKIAWVSPGAVVYDLEHVQWLLPNLEMLREGIYPSQPGKDRYDNDTRNFKAPFETVCQIAAELDIRLAQTGVDRYLVQDAYSNKLTEEQLSHKLHTTEEDVDRRIKCAVLYIASGAIPRWVTTKKRKGISYKDWKSKRIRQWLRKEKVK